jgi:hypothetical protein
MKIQKQPNNWSCFPTALAMLLNTPVKEIIAKFGHDGSERVWPELEEPNSRRGFNYQELSFIALGYGYALPLFEIETISAPNEDVTPFRISLIDCVTKLMLRHRGILLGYGGAKTHHAVAWADNVIYDPNGATYTLDDQLFVPSAFMPLIGIKST